MSDTPPSRGQRARERTRRHLLDVGLALYAERGARFTVQDLTRAAGRATGTFYNYFDDIEGFVEQLHVELARSLARGVAEAGQPDPARRFALATARLLHSAAADPARATALLRMAGKPQPDLTLVAHLADDLAEGHRLGRFSAPPDEVTLALTLGGTLMGARLVSMPLAGPEAAERLLERLLASLGVSPKEARALALEALAAAPPESAP